MRQLEIRFLILIVCILNTINFIRTQYIVDCSAFEKNVDLKKNDRNKIKKNLYAHIEIFKNNKKKIMFFVFLDHLVYTFMFIHVYYRCAYKFFHI